MHADEVDTGTDLVRRLIAAQFPQWTDLHIEPAPSGGTDNVMYRLGPHMAVRMPRIERTKRQVQQEGHWLPIFAPQLPLDVPVPIALGQRTELLRRHRSIDGRTVAPWDRDRPLRVLCVRAVRPLTRNLR